MCAKCLCYNYENNLLFFVVFFLGGGGGGEGYHLSIDSTFDERLVVILTGLTFNTTE